MRRLLVAWGLAWIALWWLWMLFVGEWNRYEWIAAAAAATVAATIGELARARTRVRARVPLHWIAKSWSALPVVFVDFGILVGALARSMWRREVVRGTFRAHEFPVNGSDPASVGTRAWVNVVAGFSPNAYVVDFDTEQKLVLLHDLVPFRTSEEPA